MSTGREGAVKIFVPNDTGHLVYIKTKSHHIKSKAIVQVREGVVLNNLLLGTTEMTVAFACSQVKH